MTRAIVSVLLAVLCWGITGCSNGVGGLQNYTDARSGYEFAYPNGWVEVEAGGESRGVEVVFRDLVQRTENLSVVVNPLPEEQKMLEDLGTPSEVGNRLLKGAIATPESGRQGELLSAEFGKVGAQTYYKLEYHVTLPGNIERHNLASVALSRGKLFTFNVSVPEQRWDRLNEMYSAMVDSFRVY